MKNPKNQKNNKTLPELIVHKDLEQKAETDLLIALFADIITDAIFRGGF